MPFLLTLYFDLFPRFSILISFTSFRLLSWSVWLNKHKKNPPFFFYVTGGPSNLLYSYKLDSFQVFVLFSWKDTLQSKGQLHIFVLQIVLLQIWLKEALRLAQTVAEWVTHSVSDRLWWQCSVSRALACNRHEYLMMLSRNESLLGTNLNKIPLL